MTTNPTELELDIVGKASKIAGTLLLPNSTAPHPFVILVSGSGPLDRDGSGAGFHLNLYNQLAVCFQKVGIASFRYDKRGIGKSTSEIKDVYYKAGIDELIEDVVTIIDVLSKREDLNPNEMFLLGHSDGAIFMPKILKAIDQQPLGVIMIAGFGQNLPTAMDFQQEKLLKEIEEKKGIIGWLLRKVMTKEKIGNQNQKLKDELQSNSADMKSEYFGFVKTPLKWFRQHFEYNPINDYDMIRCHVLVVVGDKDVQVLHEPHSNENAKKLLPNAKSSHGHVLENVNHILRDTEKYSLLDLRTEYAIDSKKPISLKVTELLGSWTSSLLNSENIPNN